MSKTLKIRWQHLFMDGQTCSRCQKTHESLTDAIEYLSDDLLRGGWSVIVEDIALLPKDIEQSNRCEFNGVLIEEIIDIHIRMSECHSCSQLMNTTAFCRSVEYQGKSYDEIPFSAFVDAIRKVTDISLYSPKIRL